MEMNCVKMDYVPERNELIGPFAIESEFLFLPFDVEERTEYESQKYVLRLHGVLENGRKLIVDVTGIRSYFDILVNDNFNMENVKDLEYEEYEFVYGKTIRGYRETSQRFLRLYFKNHKIRRRVLKRIHEENRFETYSDDVTFHYRKVARENKINLTEWYVIRSSKLTYDNGEIRYRKVLEVPVKNMIKCENPPKQEKLMIFAWDIESYTERGGDVIPDGEFIEDEVFMICAAVYWNDQVEPILKICFVTKECDKENDWKIRISEDQGKMILDFAGCLNRLNPDIVIGFNDTQYDWPFVLKKVEKLGMLKEFTSVMLGKKCRDVKYNIKTNVIQYDDMKVKKIYDKEQKQNYNVPTKNIKINFDEYAESTYFYKSGMLVIDVRIAYKKMYPTKESSLKFYLKMMGLDSKVDLPYSTLRQYYHDAKHDTNDETRRNMYEIAKYCMVDAMRCQDLLKKMNVIKKYMAESAISYVSLHDSYCFANGMKVRNLIGLIAHEMNLMITMRQNENIEAGKYPGAYVFDPIKGVERKCPVTGLDFASLYPSLMMTYNLSPEKMILDKEECVKYKKIFHEIKFMFNDREMRAWSVRHENVQENKGLYCVILEHLKDKRDEMKKEMKILKKKMEDGCKDETRFRYDYVNVVQLALKVYMNSFYGEAGNPLSSLFMRELASAVTSAGQYNIKLVSEYVKKKGFGIKYGDTDSLYLMCPDKYYEECDEKYRKEEIIKEEYWTEMVNITMNVMNELREDVNEYLFQENGTRYLKMAYEEVLFPVFFAGKKKYFGVEHVNKPNFHPEKLFVRGVDVVKRGTSKFFKMVCEEIMWKIIDIDEERDVRDIVKDVIEKNMREKREDDIFALSATYKPSKQNISVNNFANRMAAKGIMIEPGERFEYLVIRHADKNAKKYEKMVLKVRFDGVKMKLDMKYYFQSLISVCARFVNYHEDYQVQEDEYKMRDEKSQKNAENYLKNFINRVDDNMNGDITRYLVSKKRKIEEMQTKSDSVKRQKIKHQQLKRKRDEDDERQTKISRYFVNTVTKNK